MIIYLIKNKINNRCYIGQTTRPVKTRWNEHKSPLNNSCRALHNAIKKHGHKNFVVFVLYKASSIQDLNDKEKFFIKKYNTIVPFGYNLQSGGNNKTIHEKTKKKISLAFKGKKRPELSKPRGPMPINQKINISKAKKGKSNGLLNRPGNALGKKYPQHYKPILGMSGTDNLIFLSIKEASVFFGKSHTNLVAHLKGRKKSWCGYTWSYF